MSENHWLIRNCCRTYIFHESVYQTRVHLFPSLNTAEGNQRKAFGRLGGAVEAQHFNFKIETKGNRASEEGDEEKKARTILAKFERQIKF